MKTKAKPIATKPLQREGFHTTLGQHLINWEGRSLRIHTDDGGVPNLSAGYALAVKTDEGLKLRRISDMEEAVRRGTENPNFKFSSEELDRLQKTVDAVNEGEVEEAKRLIPPVGKSEQANSIEERSKNHFSFTIDKNRRLDVIKPKMDEAQQAAWNAVEKKAREQGWSQGQTDAFKKQFFNSEEMVGLASLKFNMGPNEPIPNTAEAIVTGDRARVIYEIEIRTNEGKINGIANRRIEDAKFISDTMTDIDKLALEKLKQANAKEIKAYRKDFSAAYDNSATGKPQPKPTEATEGQTGQNQVRGSQGNDDLSPERKKLIDNLTKQDNPLEEILEKNPTDLTEGELREVMGARRKAKTDAEREKLFGIEKAFFEDKFGTGDAKFDFTGKMIDFPPIKPTNKTPVPARDRDGKPITETIKLLAKAVTQRADGDGPVEVVKALQTGLNLLNRARTEKLSKKQGKVSPLFSELKDDGDSGPKTRAAFKRAAATLGAAKIKEGMALGRFKRIAEKPAFGELRRQTEGAFGNLFRRPSAAPKPKVTDEGFGLQATINDMGRDTIGNGFKPIKEDGDIGPKTETAFSQVLPAAGNDNFTSKLGENLGFFDDDDLFD